MNKYGFPSTISCKKSCDIGKIKRMVFKLIPLGYVNNNDQNRYLDFFSKAAVKVCFKIFYSLSIKRVTTSKNTLQYYSGLENKATIVKFARNDLSSSELKVTLN